MVVKMVKICKLMTPSKIFAYFVIHGIAERMKFVLFLATQNNKFVPLISNDNGFKSPRTKLTVQLPGFSFLDSNLKAPHASHIKGTVSRNVQASLGFHHRKKFFLSLIQFPDKVFFASFLKMCSRKRKKRETSFKCFASEAVHNTNHALLLC